MRISYLRVSTKDQSIQMQRNALSKYNIEREFIDEGVSGKSMEGREGLADCLEFLREGDELYIYSLSRLGRSTSDLMAIASELATRNISLISHTEFINCSSSMGRFFFTVLSALAQMERELTEERRIQGTKTALANGVKFGRKKSLSDEQLAYLKGNPEKPINHFIEKWGVSRSTIMRAKKS